jgi:hypothetical protein
MSTPRPSELTHVVFDRFKPAVDDNELWRRRRSLSRRFSRTCNGIFRT